MRVLGKEYSIKLVPNGLTGNTNLGKCDSARGEILVNSNCGISQREEVILHECLHAINYDMEIELSESQNVRLSNGIYAFLKENNVDTSFLKTE